MKIKFFSKLILTFLLISNIASAQISYQKIIGSTTAHEAGKSMQITSDGGFIIVGNSGTSSLSNNIYLSKITATGALSWTKIFSGSVNDEGFSVNQTTDGGYFITGHTNSFGAGNYDIIVIKTDSTGTLSWAKTIGGANPEYGQTSGEQTADGGYIVSGRTNSFGAGQADIYLIKLNAVGDSVWTKTYGGVGSERSDCVKQTTDGGYIISGMDGTLTSSAYLLKVDSVGNLSWAKLIGGGLTEGYSVQQTADGGYIFCGFTDAYGVGDRDIILVKLNASGTVTWTKTYGTANQETGYSVSQNSDGGYIIAGSSYIGLGDYEGVLIRTDANGNMIWNKSFGSYAFVGTVQWSDFCYDAHQTNNGGFIVTGSKQQSSSNNELYLIQTDSLGNSGCNQGTLAISTTSPSPTVIIPSPTVGNAGGIFSTPALTITSGGVVNSPCTTVQLDDMEQLNEIVFSPNPFSSILTIESTTIDGLITLFDLQGKEIFKQIATEGKTKVNSSSLSKGIYILNYKYKSFSKNFKVSKM